MKGDPPRHAQFQDPYRIGFEDAGAVKHRSKAGLNGEIFRDGILETIIELGRKQMELVPKSGGGLHNQASPLTVRPDDPRGGGGQVRDWSTVSDWMALPGSAAGCRVTGKREAGRGRND